MGKNAANTLGAVLAVAGLLLALSVRGGSGKVAVSHPNLPPANNVSGHACSVSSRVGERTTLSTPLIQRRSSSASQVAPYAEKTEANSRDIAALPTEIMEKILANLSVRDLVVCKRVTRAWQNILDTSPLLPCAFYRCCHPAMPVPRARRIIDSRHAASSSGLTGLHGEERDSSVKLAEPLTGGLHRYAPQKLFFSVVKRLAQAPAFACQRVGAIEHTHWINRGFFSPDGEHFITSSCDGTAKICRCIGQRWQEIAILSDTRVVDDAPFSPSGEFLATCGRSSEAVTIWKVSGARWQREITPLDDRVANDACFHPLEDIVATLHGRETISIWRRVEQTWQQDAVLQQLSRVCWFQFSPDGDRLLVVDEIAPNVTAVKIYYRADGGWRAGPTLQPTSPIVGTYFSPNGDHLVACLLSEGGTHFPKITVEVWCWVDGQWQAISLPSPNDFTGAHFSPLSDRLVTISRNNTVRLWSQSDGQWQEQANWPHSPPVLATRFSPCGQHLAIACGTTVTIWGTVAGQWQKKAQLTHTSGVYGVNFSADGLYITTLSWDDTANIWRLNAKEQGHNR